jgi:hypothetical protein
MAEEPFRVPTGPFCYDPNHDANDGEEWSPADVEDLENHLKHGGTIDSAAELLCRQGTKDDVRRKAKELGLLK